MPSTHTRNQRNAQGLLAVTTDAKEFNRARAVFIERVNQPGVPGNAVKLALLIAFKHMDCKTQSAWVGQEPLRKEIGAKTVRTVQNLLRILERFGLKIEIAKGWNQANTYRITPQIEASHTKPVSPDRQSHTKPAGKNSGENRRQSHAQPVSPFLYEGSNIAEGEAIASPSAWRERTRLRRAIPSRSGGPP